MALEHDSDSALAIAVRNVGSQSAFGRLIGKRQSVIHDWLREQRPLPAEHVLKVEAATGISRHALRPDIYPIENTESSTVDVDAAPAAPCPPAVGADSHGTSRTHAVEAPKGALDAVSIESPRT